MCEVMLMSSYRNPFPGSDGMWAEEIEGQPGRRGLRYEIIRRQGVIHLRYWWSCGVSCFPFPSLTRLLKGATLPTAVILRRRFSATPLSCPETPPSHPAVAVAHRGAHTQSGTEGYVSYRGGVQGPLVLDHAPLSRSSWKYHLHSAYSPRSSTTHPLFLVPD